MESKHSSIRVLGQRSIPSNFFIRPSPTRSSDSKEESRVNEQKKESRVSLSDFLNRKLQKSSAIPKSVKGKERPFKSVSMEGENGGENSKGDCVLDLAFDQFKHAIKEPEDGASMSKNNDAEDAPATGNAQESRTKRRNTFEGEEEKEGGRKRLVVLEEDSKPKRRGKEKPFISTSEKQRSFFNHYANGGGWWGSDMEGVDSDEVGCNEAWEGVGSSTLGGLEWH